MLGHKGEALQKEPKDLPPRNDQVSVHRLQELKDAIGGLDVLSPAIQHHLRPSPPEQRIAAR